MGKLIFKYDKRELPVEVIYRKRKTISIKIIPKEQIQIIAPNRTSEKYLKELIEKKSEWIEANLEKFKDFEDYSKNYEQGETYYYLGNEYTLNIIKDKNISNKKSYSYVELVGNNINIRTNNWDKNYLKEVLKKWYKLKSEEIVMTRMEELRKNSSLFRSINPSLVKVKEQKRIWGSCNSKKVVYINSKISMLPVFAIDYIIAHEFCHILELNHSREFYNLVEKIIPDYDKIATWLKQNNSKFVL